MPVPAAAAAAETGYVMRVDKWSLPPVDLLASAQFNYRNGLCVTQPSILGVVRH